tara:strand:+ start:12580 stop:12831 length:252 start_codon:yes stop_codon:yes gene_type:complete
MRGPVFLARRGYRMRRIRDLAKMLPFAGIFLLVLPMLWGRVGSDDRTTTTDGIYLFVVWGGLIAAAWLLSRGLRDEQGLKDES